MIKLSDIIKEMNGEDPNTPVDLEEVKAYIKDRLKRDGSISFNFSYTSEFPEFELREEIIGGKKKVIRDTPDYDEDEEAPDVDGWHPVDYRSWGYNEDDPVISTETRFTSVEECVLEGMKLGYFEFDGSFWFEFDQKEEIFNWMDK